MHSFILPCLQHQHAIVQNTIFTFMLDGEKKKKKIVCNYYEWENSNMFHNFTLNDWWGRIICEPLN